MDEVLGPRDDDRRVLFDEVYSDDAAFKVHWEGPFVARVRAETKDMIIKLLRNTVQSPKVMKHMNLSFFRRSLYAMRETSQRPDRCAVVPLMGSRMVGSTVRL